MAENEWCTRSDFLAECETCGKSWHSPNALAVGAQHARRLRHTVRVNIERAVIYDHDPNSSRRRIRQSNVD